MRTLTAEPASAARVSPRGRVGRSAAFAVGALVALGVLVVAGLLLGNVSVPLADTLGILGHRLLGLPGRHVAGPTETIVIELRLPRVLAAMIVGAGLGVTGAVLQGLLRNPLADPYVLGTASGAALGAAVGVLLPVQVAVLGFGARQRARVRGGARGGRPRGPASPVAGTDSRVVGPARGLRRGIGARGRTRARDVPRRATTSGGSWRSLLGSFAGASWPQVAIGLPVIVLGTLLIVARARSLDALLLGDDAAAHLGIDVRRERRHPARARRAGHRGRGRAGRASSASWVSWCPTWCGS